MQPHQPPGGRGGPTGAPATVGRRWANPAAPAATAGVHNRAAHPLCRWGKRQAGYGVGVGLARGVVVDRGVAVGVSVAVAAGEAVGEGSVGAALATGGVGGAGV